MKIYKNKDGNSNKFLIIKAIASVSIIISVFLTLWFHQMFVIAAVLSGYINGRIDWIELTGAW